jgi:hypothetical protein
VPGELHRQVAGEAVRALDDDAPNAVGGDAIEHGLEPGAIYYRVGTGDGGVVVLGDQLVAVGLGECHDGGPLPVVAVLVGPDVART